MSQQASRRRFLKAAALAGGGLCAARFLPSGAGQSPNDQIAMASIGVGGKGTGDSKDAGLNGRMVALCDVDLGQLDAAGADFPDAKKYTDFRKMFDEMGEKIDAVTVSTPDHTHAVASVMAMRLGIHCFTQKPLAHSIHEARVMARVAKETGVATQMGNQGTASDGLRKAAAVVRSGALGKVTEVHVWTNRPVWSQGGPRGPEQPVPATLDWPCWVGPAPLRPYAKGYHPFHWRGWWDFGTGALGDMACHTANMPYMALGLRDPVAIQAETSGHNGDSYPAWSKITYEFAANESRGPVTMFWYDGGKRPAPEILSGHNPAESGCVVVGEKARLYCEGNYGDRHTILGESEQPDMAFEKSPGHFEEWIRAIRGGVPATSNFTDYAGRLTETVLLGNLAVWVAREPGPGERIEWDAENLRSPNVAGLEPIVKPEYREGYSL